jgi:3D (Asp-Asp-Asp) domain-containing protein
MHSDLSSFHHTIRSIRQILVTASIVTVIGLAGVVGARTIERKPAPARYQTPRSTVKIELPATKMHVPQAQPVELLRDVPPADVTIIPGSTTTRVVMMQVTAYCSCPKCCGPNAIGITASGKDISYNAGKFVAADRSMPFGTRLLIPGYDEAPVEVIDRGGAIKGDRLDVFFPTHDEALQWGRRTVPVTILD